jgi:succinate dehydrogenase / fumarate reductase membrane anchor subunit
MKNLRKLQGPVYQWKAQRLTAAAVVVLGLGLTLSFLHGLGNSYEEARAWIQNPWVAIAFSLFIVIGLYHMFLGLEVVIEDYVHRPKVKCLSLGIIKGLCFLLGVGSILSIVKIAL